MKRRGKWVKMKVMAGEEEKVKERDKEDGWVGGWRYRWKEERGKDAGRRK